MCCRHSLAGSKQGKSRGCSRSGSKQQRRQERHFLVPTAAPAPGAPRPVCEARKVRRKVRVSGPACSGRRTAPPGTWKAKGGKEAARVLVGIFLSNQRSVLEFCEKTDRHPNTNTGHLPASSANKTCSLKAPLLPTLPGGVQKASRASSFKIK